MADQFIMFPELEATAKAVQTQHDPQALLRFLHLTQAHMGLIPQSMASTLLGISRQRFHVLLTKGVFQTAIVGGKKCVTGRSLHVWYSSRQNGRPSLTVDAPQPISAKPAAAKRSKPKSRKKTAAKRHKQKAAK